MSTGDQVFDDQVNAAYQAVEGLLDTCISSLPWKRETYHQRAATWVSGCASREIKSNNNEEPNEIKLTALKIQTEHVQTQISQYEIEAKGKGFVKWCKRAWRWLFGESSEVTLKRYWLSYQENFSLMETLHKTSDTKQRESAGKQLQTSSFEKMPSRWQKAFQEFKEWIPQYLTFLQPGGTVMPKTPSKEDLSSKEMKKEDVKPFLFLPKKKVVSVEKTDASELEKQSIASHQSTETIFESKSASLSLSSPSYEAKDSDQSLAVAFIASKDESGLSSLSKKPPTNVGKKELSAEEKRFYFFDLANYITGCGLLNLNPFDENEPITIKKARSYCRRLRVLLHTDPMELEKKAEGVEENMEFYDTAIKENKVHFNTINKGLEYLEKWFEKYQEAPKLSEDSMLFSDYISHKRQYEKALSEYENILNCLQLNKILIAAGKKIHDGREKQTAIIEEMKKQQAEKSRIYRAETDQKIAAERQLRIAAEVKMCQELAEMSQKIGETGQELAEIHQGEAEIRQGLAEIDQGEAEIRQGLAEIHQGVAEMHQGVAEIRQGLVKSNNRLDAFLLLIEQQGILAAPAKIILDQSTIVSSLGNELREPSTVSTMDLNSVSTEQDRATGGDETSRFSSPVRVTRELYRDVFKAGAGQVAAKPEKDFSPSPV